MTRHFKNLPTFLKTHKLASLAVLVVVIVIALAFAYSGSWFNSGSSTKVVVAGNPVAAPAVNKTTQPVKKAPQSSAGGSVARGGVTDTRGSNSGSSNSSQWVTSASGVITVKSPTANATLRSGDVIAGSAKVSQIHYRLKDNRAGQIAEGTLSVVNGNFSGKIHFSPQGTGGQLDIFTTDDMGIEYNEVQINVAF